MISKKLQDAINEQINKELFSEYLYVSMRAWFAQENLDGFGNWMDVQSKEEREHAMGLYIFLINRGGKVDLKALAKPQMTFKDAKDIYTQTLEHERMITKSLNDLMDMAAKEKDSALVSFLKWYIDEQVEEEANPEKILSKLNLIKERVEALMMLDTELAARVYTPLMIPGAVLV